MLIDHRTQAAEQQRRAEFAAAARQGVVTLMSLDFNKAKEDVQRIIDNSTGQFREDFKNQADDFIKVAQDSKVVTEVTVNATGVESMTEDSAVVLVSATSRVTNAAGARAGAALLAVVRQPRARRRPNQDVESGVRTVTTKDAVDATEVDETETGSGHRRTRRRGRRRGHRNGNAVRETRWRLASVHGRGGGAESAPSSRRLLLLASAGVAAWLYFGQYRPGPADQRRRRRCSARRGEDRHRRAAVVLTGEPGQGLRSCEVASDRRLPVLLHAVHPADRHAGRQAEVGEDRRPPSCGPRCRKCIRIPRWCWCSSTRPPPARRIPTALSPRARSRWA